MGVSDGPWRGCRGARGGAASAGGEARLRAGDAGVDQRTCFPAPGQKCHLKCLSASPDSRQLFEQGFGLL
jgi:hypothetical protein